MKKITVLVFLSFILISCKKETKNDSKASEVIVSKKESFPEELGKIFTKHGGIEAWRKARVLSFNKGDEVHTIDLHSRKTVVNHPDYSLGFDGSTVWLSEEKEGTYKGNPTFYYNLYFYFYAMPFVLADDGIIYEKAAPISFEGTTYPGYKISYKANVGTSPDDNYMVYYNPKTYQMEWLAYTVTFNSKVPSDRYNLIKYNQWENVNGLILPKKITWYNKDNNGNPTTAVKPATEFTLPLISQGKLANSFFAKPAN